MPLDPDLTPDLMENNEDNVNNVNNVNNVDNRKDDYDNMCYWIGSYVFSFINEGKALISGNLDMFKYILGRCIVDPDFSNSNSDSDSNDILDDAFRIPIPPQSP